MHSEGTNDCISFGMFDIMDILFRPSRLKLQFQSYPVSSANFSSRAIKNYRKNPRNCSFGRFQAKLHVAAYGLFFSPLGEHRGLETGNLLRMFGDTRFGIPRLLSCPAFDGRHVGDRPVLIEFSRGPFIGIHSACASTRARYATTSRS